MVLIDKINTSAHSQPCAKPRILASHTAENLANHVTQGLQYTGRKHNVHGAGRVVNYFHGLKVDCQPSLNHLFGFFLPSNSESDNSIAWLVLRNLFW